MISHVYRRLHPDKPSTTIIASGGGGTWGYHYEEPRPRLQIVKEQDYLVTQMTLYLKEQLQK